MATTTKKATLMVRIKPETHRRLQTLARESKRTLPEVLDEAISEYERKQFLEECNAAYARLRADPEAWQEELEERLRFVLGQGLKGVLICPAIVGLDTMRSLADRRKAVFMAHPAYSGAFYAERSHGIEHSLYLGTMMRLAGADITVFPNAGGRFAFTPEECRAIAERSRSSFGGFAPIWPAPGGGMNLDNTAAMTQDFGTDAIWLIGGRLLMHPGGPEAGARAFREKMAV